MQAAATGQTAMAVAARAVMKRRAASWMMGQRGATLSPCTCSFSTSSRRSNVMPDSIHPSPSIELDSPSHQLDEQPLTGSSASTSASSSSPKPAYGTSQAISLLRSQPSHYIVASLYQRRYLLTPKDLLTVPRLKDLKVGDVIQLDRIHELGSRDYTLRASVGNTLSSDIVSCKATVVEHTKGRMEETIKFKRRKGYKKTIKNKSKYTRLRVGEIGLGGESVEESAEA